MISILEQSLNSVYNDHMSNLIPGKQYLITVPDKSTDTVGTFLRKEFDYYTKNSVYWFAIDNDHTVIVRDARYIRESENDYLKVSGPNMVPGKDYLINVAHGSTKISIVGRYVRTEHDVIRKSSRYIFTRANETHRVDLGDIHEIQDKESVKSETSVVVSMIQQARRTCFDIKCSVEALVNWISVMPEYVSTCVYVNESFVGTLYVGGCKIGVHVDFDLQGPREYRIKS